MEEIEDLTIMRTDLGNRVRDAMDKAVSYSQDFLEYGHLWTDDRKVSTGTVPLIPVIFILEKV